MPVSGTHTDGADADLDPQAEVAVTRSTTGTGENETFVGQAAGQDDGYVGETGVEACSERG